MGDLGDGSELVWLEPDGTYVSTLKATADSKPYTLKDGVYTPREELWTSLSGF